MNQEKFWLLLSKKFTREATADELAELEVLIQKQPEWQYAIQNLESFFNSRPTMPADEIDAAYKQLRRKLELTPSTSFSKNRIPVSKKIIRYAAAACIVVVLGIGVWLNIFSKTGNVTSQNPYNEISTKNGSSSKIVLPDGSEVVLNAGSKITYDKNFGVTNREVHLSGEAFFDVKKQEKMPFYIHTDVMDIKVVGTAFNVKAYPEDKNTETSLLRGSIEISIKSRPQDKIVLAPHEKLIINKDQKTSSLNIAEKKAAATPVEREDIAVAINQLKYNTSDSTLPEIEWMAKRLVFADEPFEELVKKLQRWYDVTIDLQNERMKNTRFTGSFENETIEQALEALRFSDPFQFQKIGNKIIIN